MGITLKNRAASSDFDVSIDTSHNDGVDMTVGSNPTVTSLNGFDIYAIFRRRRLSVLEVDGNPLIYALKSKAPYHIDQQNSDLMWEVANAVWAAWTCPWKPTAVVPIPSSHDVSNVLAQKVADWLGIPFVSSDMIVKQTVLEVITAAEARLADNSVPQHHVRALKKQLGKLGSSPPGKAFQMKEVKEVEVRPYLVPWKLDGSLEPLAGHELVLVDDLIGSGASITTCSDFLKANGCTVVGGLSLFSPLDRELANVVPQKRGKKRR